MFKYPFKKCLQKRKFSKVAIIGGNGFLGKSLVKKLQPLCKEIIIGCRYPSEVVVQGDNVSVKRVDVLDSNSISEAIKDSTTVINCSNIYYESEHNYVQVFIQGTQNLVVEAKKTGAQYIHFSCMGSEIDSLSHFADLKYRGEDKAYSILPTSVIIRPNLILSSENTLLKRLSLPIVPGGNTLVQPVLLEDLMEAVKIIIENKINSKSFDLSGPQQVKFSKLIQLIRNSSFALPVDLRVADLILGLRQFLPNPPCSRELVPILKKDLIAEKTGFETLGIQPKNIL